MYNLIIWLDAFARRLNLTDGWLVRFHLQRRLKFRCRSTRCRGQNGWRLDHTVLSDTQREGDDFSDVRLWAVHLDRNTKTFAEQAHGLETFLVVRTTSANKDFDVVSNQATLELFQGTDDALEGRGDIGKVGDTTADDKDLAIRVGRAASNKINCIATQSGWSPGTGTTMISSVRDMTSVGHGTY